MSTFFNLFVSNFGSHENHEAVDIFRRGSQNWVIATGKDEGSYSFKKNYFTSGHGEVMISLSQAKYQYVE